MLRTVNVLFINDTCSISLQSSSRP